MTRMVDPNEYAQFLLTVAEARAGKDPVLNDAGDTIEGAAPATFRIRPLQYEPPQHVPNRTLVTTCNLLEVLHNGEWLIVGREFAPHTDATSWGIEDEEWARISA